MTQAAPTPAGWNPDPFGRFQWRYWDGAQWTDQVATNGQQATDPPTGEVVPPDRSVFEAPTLVFVYVGDDAKGSWPVYVGNDRVASVTVDDKLFGTDRYFVTDAAGRPLLQVHVTSLVDPEYMVLDPAGTVLGVVAPPQGLVGRQWYEFLTADRQVIARTVKTTVVDAANRDVARMTWGDEKISWTKRRAWISFERDTAVADPLRQLLLGWLFASYDALMSQKARSARRRRRMRHRHS